MVIKEPLAIGLERIGGLGWGWHTSAATDQGTLSRIAGWKSVTGGPGVGDESG
jgi:hypothetical protein